MKNSFLSTIAAGALLLAGTTFAAAQDAAGEDAPKVPNITQVKMDFKTVPMPNSDPQNKWARAEVEFAVPPTAAKGGKTIEQSSGGYLTNLKLTLTLGYKKTAKSLGTSNARGKKGEAIVAAEKKEQGDALSADFTTYRASVTFPCLKVVGKKRKVQFFIPGEIVERDKEAMSGNAKPVFAYVTFTYKDMEIGPFDAAGKMRQGFFEDNGVTKTKITKVDDFDKLCNEIADPGVGETKGLLMPYYLTPNPIPDANTPTILRASEVEQ